MNGSITKQVTRNGHACEKASVRYELKKLKSGFVVCFYRSEKSEDNSTDITVKSTDKVRINTDKLNSSQKKSKRKISQRSDFVTILPHNESRKCKQFTLFCLECLAKMRAFHSIIGG